MQAKTFTVSKKLWVKFVEILEIDSSASNVEIKRAFLQLAKKYHPDVNNSPNAQKHFSEINEAYETLSDSNKRQIYDATGMSSNDQQNMNQQGGGFGFNPFGFAFGGTKAAADMRSFDEILKEFEDFFTIDPKKT